MGIAAVLASERIPIGIFTSRVMREIEVGEAVAALAEVSLLTKETLDEGSPCISVHRLVQEVIRQNLRSQSTVPWARITISAPADDASSANFWQRWFRKRSPEGDTELASPDGLAQVAAFVALLVLEKLPHDYNDRYARAADPFLPHALRILDFMATQGPCAEIARRLLNVAAVLLQYRADFAPAERLHRKEVEIAETELGPDHPATGAALNNVAKLLRQLRRYSEAEPLYRRALAIAANDPQEPSNVYNCFGLMLHQSGRLPEAERLYLKALDMMPQTEDGGSLVRAEVTLQVCRAEIIIPSGFLSMINQGSAWRSSTPASLPSRPS
ncbi:MAG: tetratricopeptide repeat protein [Hyphomicrobiaceae bacterium]|nr:MAG: tetratricopeptide repeat protein [Hyphomicrobiaceae bacterium]